MKGELTADVEDQVSGAIAQALAAGGKSSGGQVWSVGSTVKTERGYVLHALLDPRADLRERASRSRLVGSENGIWIWGEDWNASDSTRRNGGVIKALRSLAGFPPAGESR